MTGASRLAAILIVEPKAEPFVRNYRMCCSGIVFFKILRWIFIKNSNIAAVDVDSGLIAVGCT